MQKLKPTYFFMFRYKNVVNLLVPTAVNCLHKIKFNYVVLFKEKF